MPTSYLGHLAPVHFHFRELNPGARKSSAQEKKKATRLRATSGLGPRSARARGSPGLIPCHSSLRTLAFRPQRLEPRAGAQLGRARAEGQIVPSAAPHAPPRLRSPRPSGPASASGGGKWAAARPPLLPLGPGGCTKLLREK